MWMTEVCCYHGGFAGGYDPTMASGMWLANTIWLNLIQAQDTGFLWWTALSPVLGCVPSKYPRCPLSPQAAGWDDGLLYYDWYSRTDHIQSLYFTKRFWVLANFSRFVRPPESGIRVLPRGRHGRSRPPAGTAPEPGTLGIPWRPNAFGTLGSN